MGFVWVGGESLSTEPSQAMWLGLDDKTHLCSIDMRRKVLEGGQVTIMELTGAVWYSCYLILVELWGQLHFSCISEP